MTTITKGTKGTDVKILQACLRMLQYTDADNKPIEITGTADTKFIDRLN